MKKIVLLLVSVFFLFSCELDDTFPRIETTTNGKKWNLEIGSSPEEVYSQLQELGLDKGFDDVAVVSRQAFSKPDEIISELKGYRSITLQTTSGVTERILIQFNEEKVTSIDKGGALLEPILRWPEDGTNEGTISIEDPISEIHQKLVAIYQIPEFEKYEIVLPDKWLEKPFDPEMENYDEWAFSFSEDLTSSKVGRYSVRLHFKNKELVKIRQEYNENEVVN